MPSRAAVAAIVCALLSSGCTSPPVESPSPTESATTVATTAAGVPAHIVGVRVVDGNGEFYDTLTQDTFTPRGVNFNFWVADAGGGISDALLSEQYWDEARVNHDLGEVEALGFNTVRIMIDVANPAYGAIDTGESGRELNGAFLDNLASFLGLAKSHGLRVFVASNTLPDGSWWINQTASHETPQFQGAANEFFTPVGVDTYVDYWGKVVQGLADRHAATDTILGYELRQEYHVYANQPPFSLDAGVVTAANGKSYDMASQDDKDLLYDEGTAYWEDQIRTRIREVDPTALVTVGFFTPNAPHKVMPPDDARLVQTRYFIEHSSADFIDIHHYPGNGVDDNDIWENFSFASNPKMPVLLGEYGAIKEWWSSESAGAAAAMSMEVGACRAGIDGYLLWAWRGDALQDIYWASEGEGLVGQAIAPVNRPDPCEYGDFDFITYNAALTAKAKATSSVGGLGPSNINDGTNSYWNASGGAPQAVTLDLSAPRTISRFELVVAQDPPGRSVHELWVQVEGGKLKRVHTFDGKTSEGDVLAWEPAEPILGVTRVKVVTTYVGDLWPAWHEVVLVSPDPEG